MVLPTNLLPILRNALHYSIMGNHSSTDIMYRKLKEHYFHPKLRDKLKEIGENCVLCAINKPSYGKQLSFGEKNYPKAPRIGYSFDIACGYPAINSYKYIYLYLDEFTGYCICVPAKTKSSQEILKSLKENVVKYFDYPQYLFSDREGALHSKEIKSYCETHNMELRSTPGYSPFSNGYCEKMIGIQKIALNLLVRGQGQSWIDMLGYANLAINQRLLSSNYSLQMLALGQSSQSLALLKKDMDFENHKDFF